ncbi:hypothetical protein ACIA5G_06015 [Amycolatopsis sp. NPDC051758]|uniref:hypothetical protein n=1 Tax=Amycolatopsis sp. NPDC051758 TaxID=3363935 RepID=UPI0037ACA1DC
MTDTARRYPIPARTDDVRFTFGLILDVADVLARHGYRPLTAGDDFAALHQALFRFLYATTPTTSATDPAGLDPATEEC